MNVKETIEWLQTLDPEAKVILEGLTYSSNVHKDTGEFYIYKESVEFSPKFSDIIPNHVFLGLDV